MNENNSQNNIKNYRKQFHLSLGFLIVLGLIVSLGCLFLLYQKLLLDDQPNICLTKACIKASSRILDNIDSSVDPCEDFNRFSCGSFIENNRIPKDKSKFDVFDILKNELAFFISDVLQRKEDKEDIPATIKAKKLYKSCINEELINLNGEKNFLKMIESDFGGWPILRLNENPSSKSLTKKLISLRKLGFKPFIDIKVSPNPKQPRSSILKLKQPSWFFNKQYYTDEKFETAYKSYFTKYVTYLNPVIKRSEVIKDIDRVFEMEKLIAMRQSERNRRTAGYKNMTIKMLTEEIPNFDWEDHIINGIFKEIINITITRDEPIIVYEFDFVVFICDFLADKNNNQIDIENLMVWASLRKEVLSLPSKYKEAKLEFEKVYRGATKDEPRDLVCAYLTLNSMEYAVGRLYVSEKFDKNSKTVATNMIEAIRQEFIQILKENKWLDKKSSRLALDKANYIESNVGYPEYIYNDTHMNHLYENYHISEEDYLENSLVMIRLEVIESFEKLRIIQKSGWLTGPAIVNAFYSSYSNQICLPAGILQAPFYDVGYPNYLNYGGIGSVIGHEITHGFDERGRLHDKNGVLFPDGNNSLWTQETIQSYKEKVQCFINQYSNFHVKQINKTLNGEKSLSENIADNGGLKQSFRAYEKWVEKNGPEPLLPGLKYTQNQLFFINNAQIWCAKYRDEYLNYQVISANHSPGEFRINGPTTNSESFAEVFQCKPNQKNNPTNKCSVW